MNAKEIVKQIREMRKTDDFYKMMEMSVELEKKCNIAELIDESYDILINYVGKLDYKNLIDVEDFILEKMILKEDKDKIVELVEEKIKNM